MKSIVVHFNTDEDQTIRSTEEIIIRQVDGTYRITSEFGKIKVTKISGLKRMRIIPDGENCIHID